MAFRHLLPVGISLALGVAIFMYWSASSQLQEIRQSNRALKRELTSSRSERDNVQYRLNLVKSDLEQAVRNKEESERRAQELDEQLQEERGKLRVCQHQLELSNSRREDAEQIAKDCRDHSSTLEEVADQLKTQLSACETDNKEAKAASDELQHQLQQLQAELHGVTGDKSALAEQLRESLRQAQEHKQQLDHCQSQVEMMSLSDQLLNERDRQQPVGQAFHKMSEDPAELGVQLPNNQRNR